MQTLSDFLASAPKTYLAKLYRRDNPDAGLVSGSKVVEAVEARAIDPDRLKALLLEMEAEGRRLLLAIYASEERGMLESELMRGCEGGSGPGAYFLGLLESELMVVRRDGEHRSYHGFLEISRLILPTLLEEFVPHDEPPAQTSWISNAPHAASHFCHFLAKAARGELRLTQTGELHRKSLLDLSRGFASGDMLSTAVAEEEAVFLFRFAVDSELLTEDAGLLRLSPSAMEWLENGSGELDRRLRSWWLRKRARGLSRLLRFLSESTIPEDSDPPARGASSLSPLFAVYEGWDKLRARATTDKTTWENLSRLLRELWLLGGAEFAMTKGRIRWVRVLPHDDEGEGRERGPRPEESPRGLPNFEALVPAGIPLARLFQVELLAVRENDERLTRYRFTKDSVVAGLRAGMSPESLDELATWLSFESPARRVMAEWAATYASAVFREVFMLRVRDAGRFSDLESFPQFMELVTEVIPNYGFVLPRSARDSARELLHAFDLLPGEEVENPAGRSPVIAGEIEPSWALPVFSHGEAVYRQVIPVRRETAPDRAAAKERVEDPALRLRTLENAIAAQKAVEFNYDDGSKGAARLRIQPLHVLRNRDPMKLIAVDLTSGHRNEYLIDLILALQIEEAA